MTTKLDRSLKRELVVAGNKYTLTISPLCLHLAPKGRRKGYELSWESLVNGDAALVTALNESLRLVPELKARRPAKSPLPAAKRNQAKTKTK